MNKEFYKAFEDRFRGSRRDILDRLDIYKDFVTPLLKLDSQRLAIDLGCGRGEWLELMQKIGFNPYGVDLDDGMLSSCLELNLKVCKADAIDHIRSLQTNSQLVVSAFHVIEHISFNQLQILVNEALRVLKPGGILILETPNPENIIVATNSFYFDPTHIRPIPSELLSFILEHAGFDKIKLLRLQENKQLINKSNITLSDVISGVSPDYAFIAQKNGSTEQVEILSNVFKKEMGLSLNSLLSRLDSRLDSLEAIIKMAETKAHEAETKASHIKDQLDSVLSSNSWRLTRPLRLLKYQFEIVQKKSQKEINSLKIWCLVKKADLRRLIIWIVRKLGLHRVIFRIYHQKKELKFEYKSLNPRAQEVYLDLKLSLSHIKESK